MWLLRNQSNTIPITPWVNSRSKLPTVLPRDSAVAVKTSEQLASVSRRLAGNEKFRARIAFALRFKCIFCAISFIKGSNKTKTSSLDDSLGAKFLPISILEILSIEGSYMSKGSYPASLLRGDLNVRHWQCLLRRTFWVPATNNNCYHWLTLVTVIGQQLSFDSDQIERFLFIPR